MRFIFLILLFHQSLIASVFEFKGKAIDDNGKVAYNEEHKVTFNDTGKILLTETTYFYEGKKIAYLYNNYENHPYVPTHKFEDFRFNYDYGLKFTDDKKKVVMYYNDKEDKKKEEIELEKNSFSSQGFNTYFSQNLAEVKDGKVFDFIIPGKMTRVDFKVSPKKKDKLYRFILEADSFFIRLLAPTMTIDYSADGRIRYYKGPSNLPAKDEGVLNVEITYQYADEK